MPTNLPCQTTLFGFVINYDGQLKHAEVVKGSEVVEKFDCRAKPGEKPTALTDAIAFAKAESKEPKKPKTKPKTEAR